MANEDIARLRKQLGDKVAMEELYSSDTAFRSTVDQYRGAMKNMSPVAEAKFPTAMLNKHYLKSFSPTPPVSPRTTAMANQAMAIGRQNAETKEKTLKGFAGNVVESGKNYLGNVADAAKNVFSLDPQKNTLLNIGKTALGAGANAVESVAGAVTGKDQEGLLSLPGEDQASRIGEFYKQRYGSAEAIGETFYNDPIGFLSDASTLIAGVGGAVNVAGKAAGLAGVAKAGATVAKAGARAEPLYLAGKAVQKTAGAAAGMARFGTAQMSGLGTDTLKTITSNTDNFSAAQKGTISRQTIADKVLGATQGKLDDLSDTGKAYEGVRKGAGAVEVPGDHLVKMLKSKGIKVESADDGLKVKLTADIDTSIPMTKGELGELEEFVNLVNGKGKLTNAQFLNVRNKLTQMSKFDASKSDAFRAFAKDLRKEWNNVGRKQVKGLEELDNQYGPLIEEVDSLKRDFVEIGPDGKATLKDSALSRIANLTRKGNEKKLARVKELVPEIADEINAVKALEDVQLASGQKVGTYFRGAVGAVGLGSGNIPAVVASILTTPSIIVPLLKAYGKAMNLPKSVLNRILDKVAKGERFSEEQAAIVAAAIERAETSGEGIDSDQSTQ